MVTFVATITSGSPVPKTLIYSFLLLILVSSCHIAGNSGETDNVSIDSVLTRTDKMYESGHKDSAIAYITWAHAQAGKLSLRDEMRYATYINIAYSNAAEYDKSIILADSMLTLLEREGSNKNREIYIQTYSIKADALMAKGMYNEAYDYYYKAKSLSLGTTDSCSLSSYNHSLGMVLYRQQKYMQAALYFKQSYEEAGFCGDNFTYFYLKQELLDNIGLCYGKAGAYDSAQVYYKKCLEYIQASFGKFPNKPAKAYESAEAVVWGNLADVYVAVKNYDSARSLLQRSIGMNLQKGYANTDAELGQVKLADIYLETKQQPELKQLLADIKAELDTIPNEFAAVQWERLSNKYYEQQGDSVNAYRHLLAYLSRNDSLQLQNKTLASSDIDGRLKSQEKQYQISLLQKNKKTDEMLLIIAIVVVAMSVSIIFLSLRYSRRVRRDMKILTKLNEEVNDNKAKLEMAIKEVEFRDKDKSRILRSVAHDVMSPISAISALADILISENEDRPEQQEMLQLMQDACNNSLSLSRDILDAAVAIAPGDLNKEWIDVNKLVAGCVDLLNARAHTKHQNIVIESAGGEIMAYVHKDKIWRVVNNLLVNAIKFSYEQAEIVVGIKKTSKKVIISVADTGMGIPEKNKLHIFDMFTESKTYGTSGEKPHGIGLSISLQVVRAHGGDIWFESREGKGTTFYVSLPENTTKG